MNKYLLKRRKYASTSLFRVYRIDWARGIERERIVHKNIENEWANPLLITVLQYIGGREAATRDAMVWEPSRPLLESPWGEKRCGARPTVVSQNWLLLYPYRWMRSPKYFITLPLDHCSFSVCYARNFYPKFQTLTYALNPRPGINQGTQ